MKESLDDWLRLIRAEYDEIPGLQLTHVQVERLWRLDRALAESLLHVLVSSGFLKKTLRGTYIEPTAVERGLNVSKESAQPRNPNVSGRSTSLGLRGTAW